MSKKKKKLTAEQKRAMICRKMAENRSTNVGKVYQAHTKYIDKDSKHLRNFVVIRDNGRNVTVAKLKSIKKFDANKKNADPALVEINSARYGLHKRTGVDLERFYKNRMSDNPLQLNDKKVFPKQKEEFTLGSHDKHAVLVHTGIIDKKKRDK